MATSDVNLKKILHGALRKFVRAVNKGPSIYLFIYYNGGMDGIVINLRKSNPFQSESIIYSLLDNSGTKPRKLLSFHGYCNIFCLFYISRGKVFIWYLQSLT